MVALGSSTAKPVGVQIPITKRTLLRSGLRSVVDCCNGIYPGDAVTLEMNDKPVVGAFLWHVVEICDHLATAVRQHKSLRVELCPVF
jgi:hypothetical protein